MTIVFSFILLLVPIAINLLFPREVTTATDAKSTNYKVYYLVTTGIFIFSSILICWRLKIIMKIIKRAFGKDLSNQTFWLRLTMITFVLSYVIRCVTMILMFFDILPDIFNDIGLSSGQAILYVLQYLIYNHLPIGMILILHHKNFDS